MTWRCKGVSGFRPPALFPVLFAVLLLALPRAAAPAPSGPQFIAERPFQGPITHDMALQAAKAAARQAAMQALARDLVTRPDVQFVGKAGPSPIPRDPLALAYASARLQPPQSQSQGRPLQARVAVRLAVSWPDDQELRQALLQTARLALYARAVTRETVLLAEYDTLSTRLLRASASKQELSQPELSALQEIPDRLRALAAALEGMDLYLEALRDFSGTWGRPQESAALMQRILSLDPDNAPALNAYGECCLLLGRLQESQEAQRKALALVPDFDRAFHARGAANLALGLPALAVADFTEAIRLSPHNAEYRRDRAAAWLVREETEPMCRDFRDACALGDCAGYQWALTQGRCPRSNDEPQPSRRLP